MVEKVKPIANPLTIIAIFAALAEINATVTIGLVDKSLQGTFIWFVLGFPTLLVLLFFGTLYTKPQVIYAPGDYKDDNTFRMMLRGDSKPDQEINNDVAIIEKTKEELGIDDNVQLPDNLRVPESTSYLFSVRFALEKEVRRLGDLHISLDGTKGSPMVMMLGRLEKLGIISETQFKAARNIYSITSPAIHGEDSKITLAEMNFVREIGPGLVEELRRLN